MQGGYFAFTAKALDKYPFACYNIKRKGNRLHVSQFAAKLTSYKNNRLAAKLQAVILLLQQKRLTDIRLRGII